MVPFWPLATVNITEGAVSYRCLMKNETVNCWVESQGMLRPWWLGWVGVVEQGTSWKLLPSSRMAIAQKLTFIRMSFMNRRVR